MKSMKKKKISKKDLMYDSYLKTLHELESISIWLESEESKRRPENMRRFYEGRFDSLCDKLRTLSKMMKLNKFALDKLENFILRFEKIKEGKRYEIEEFF